MQKLFEELYQLNINDRIKENIINIYNSYISVKNNQTKKVYKTI